MRTITILITLLLAGAAHAAPPSSALSGATVTLPKKTVTHDEPGIWDGDTADIRLGQSTADGNPEVQFKAVGPKFDYWFASDGKLLKFDGPIGTYTAE
jgi:hypothetical protein